MVEGPTPTQFDPIPSLLGLPVGDLEDLRAGQIALSGYFCDNLDQPRPGQRYLARQLRYQSRPRHALSNALDLGDVNVFPLEPEKHRDFVTSQCRAVLETGARLVLVGGDSSGLEALLTAAESAMGTEVQARSLSEAEQAEPQGSAEGPLVLSVDLQALGAAWLSQPRRLSGLSPAQMIARVEGLSGTLVAAAIFGLAPALDSRGTGEVSAALLILQAVVRRLQKGAA